MGETIATCPRKAESSSHSSTTLFVLQVTKVVRRPGNEATCKSLTLLLQYYSPPPPPPPPPRAADLGHFEVLQVLSAYRADFTVATTTGDNAIHFATRANKLLCLRFLGQRGECCMVRTEGEG